MTCSPGSPASTATPAPAAFLRLAAWSVLCVLAPVLLLRSPKAAPTAATELAEHLPPPVEQPLEPNVCAAMDYLNVPAVITRLKATKPEYIGIGNSMLFTRLGRTQAEVEEFNKMTGHNFCFILRGGSTSAAWYLTLKNVVAASGVHPKMVFFFFRDTELTSPYANTTGKHAAYLKSLRSASEPVLDRVLQLAPASQGLIDGTINRLSWWLSGPKGIYNFSQSSDKMQHRMTSMAMKFGGGKVLKANNQQVLTDRFSLDHLRADVPADIAWQDNNDQHDLYSTFSDNYVNGEQASFLPAMMDVARDNGLKLLFFRVKRRPDMEDGVGVKEPEQMRGYIKRLQGWIEERGGLLFDEAYDPAIKLEAYNDGDHIGVEHRGWYQRYFWDRVKGLFP